MGSDLLGCDSRMRPRASQKRGRTCPAKTHQSLLQWGGFGLIIGCWQGPSCWAVHDSGDDAPVRSRILKSAERPSQGSNQHSVNKRNTSHTLLGTPHAARAFCQGGLQQRQRHGPLPGASPFHDHGHEGGEHQRFKTRYSQLREHQEMEGWMPRSRKIHLS